MLNLAKSLSITHQQYKLLLFYILNLIDALFTQFLIFKMPDVFIEINPFLSPIVNEYQFLIIKIALPITLMIYWDKRYKKSNDKNKYLANVIINSTIILFLMINLLHILNISLYITIH